MEPLLDREGSLTSVPGPMPFNDAPSRRGQRGSVLLFVLGILILLTFGVVAVLNMSGSSVRVASNLETSTKTIHRIDGSMEYATNLVRQTKDECTDPSNEVQVVTQGDNDGDFTSDYDVFCIPSIGVVQTAGRRTVDLYATDASDTVVARARVRVADTMGGVERIGYTVEVCDWILTAKLVASVDPGSTDPDHGVRGCSS